MASSTTILLILLCLTVLQYTACDTGLTTGDGLGLTFTDDGSLVTTSIGNRNVSGSATGGLTFTLLGEDDEVTAANYLNNEGFETAGTSADRAASWNNYVIGYNRTATEYHSGSYSIMMNNNNSSMQGASCSWTAPNQTISFLKLSGWSKALDVTGVMDGNYALYLDIYMWDGPAQYGETAMFATGTHDWLYTERVIQLEGHIKSVSVYLLFRNHNGTVYFDDIHLSSYVPSVVTLGPLGLDSPNVYNQFGSARGLQFDVMYTVHATHIRITMTVTNTDDTKPDRFVTLRSSIPVDVAGDDWTWGYMPQSEQHVNSSTLSMSYVFNVNNAVDSAYYPVGSLTSATAGIGLSMPMDGPLVTYYFGYTGIESKLQVVYNFAITDKITKSDLYNKVTISYDIFKLTEPSQGMRSALERHYRDIHPDIYLERVVPDQGIWMAFSKISDVSGYQDFGFKFYEGSSEPNFTNANNIHNYPYVEPALVHLTYNGTWDSDIIEAFLLNCSANHTSNSVKNLCKEAISGGMRHKNGSLVYIIEVADWNVGFMVPVSSDGNITRPAYPANYTRYDEMMTSAAGYYSSSVTYKYNISGIYLDSLESSTTLLNYGSGLIAALQHPAIFTADLDVVSVMAHHTLSFSRQIASYVRQHNDTMFANYVYDRWPFYTSAIDVAGIEARWLVNGVWTPNSHALLSRYRTLSYRKPYLMLQNSNYSVWTHSHSLMYMDRCMHYGIFPSYFSPSASANGAYFGNPEWYNRDRSLFLYFIPRIQMLTAAGYYATTWAKGAADNATVLMERWGSSSFTLLAESVIMPCNVVVTVTTSAIGLVDSLYYIQYDSYVGNGTVHSRATDGVLIFNIIITPNYTNIISMTVDCGDYNAPTGYAKTSCDNTTIGAVCNLECDDGYEGTAADAVCQANGVWTPTNGCAGTCVCLLCYA